MPSYDPLPRSSRSSSRTRRLPESSSSSSSPRYSRGRNKKGTLRLLLTPIHVLLLLPRRIIRLISHRRRPLSVILITTIIIIMLLLTFTSLNAPYAPSNAPPFSLAPSTAANETVFIAANIISRSLILGAWGDSLVELIHLIGQERVFVSIYGGPGDALKVLDGRLEKLGVGRRIVDENADARKGDKGGKWKDMGVTSVRLPGGERRVKRIAWLAALRNKVLEPLYHPSSSSSSSPGSQTQGNSPQYKPTKVLFLNDVFFNPSSALRLLFGTKLHPSTGLTDYKAVCAADFVSRGWKYYDTFATRDTEGYGIGVPIFPWFVRDGEGVSRRDVLQGRDAVRVKSCWGGMVAFKGSYFWGPGEGKGSEVQAHPKLPDSSPPKRSSARDAAAVKSVAAQNGIGIPNLPLSFRSEPEPFWDSSECCLIHADIMALPDLPSSLSSSSSPPAVDPHDTGIYLNPFVRTSYTSSTHQSIPLAQRFERLLSPIQRVLNYLAHMPVWNARRTEREGMKVGARVWVSRKGGKGGVGGEDVESVVGWAEGGFEGDVGGGGDNLTRIGKVKQKREEKRIGKREVLGKVQSKEYWAEQGFYVDYERTARRGGYCGVRQLLVMKEGEVGEGEGNWNNLLDRVPPIDV
ncbi:hypothetical protein VTL71DRAFT_4904 [Oculimacula yallundae]|uniref:Glycosyltransferase family 69 protein n=1 Tax=Oculimacula yallundae TaxID=86028 RepID=A0ABR4C3A4_9HELO